MINLLLKLYTQSISILFYLFLYYCTLIEWVKQFCTLWSDVSIYQMKSRSCIFERKIVHLIKNYLNETHILEQIRYNFQFSITGKILILILIDDWLAPILPTGQASANFKQKWETFYVLGQINSNT